VIELDGKDINEQERRYLVNLLNRKKIQGTVYNDMKKKKQNFMVDGSGMHIHKQKQMILDGGPKRDGVSFVEFKEIYGKGQTDEEVWINYMQFMEEQGKLDDLPDDIDANKNQIGVPATSIGRSKNINSNTDFTVAGVHTANTKHVPYAVRKGGY